jgi:hypothetical protein
MAKKLIPQTEEWGNIELPGLSDEELLSKDWHKVGINKDRFSNKEFKDSHRQAIIKAVNTDEVKAKKKKAQKKFRTESYNKKHKEVMEKLYASADWQNKVKKANANPIRNQKIREAHARGVFTPLGKFLTLGEAAKAHNITSEGIRYRIKTKPKDYYYID